MKAVLISLLISQIIPTVLNIFNIIYSATGAYRRNFPLLKKITQTLGFGLMGGIAGILIVGGILFPLLGLEILLVLAVGIPLTTAQVPQALNAAISLTLDGLNTGIFIGLLIGIYRSLSLRPHLWRNLYLHLLIGFVLISLYAFLYTVEGWKDTSVFYLFISLYGFVVGVIANEISLPWRWVNPSLIVLFLGILVATKWLPFPFKLSIFQGITLLISVFIICLLFGYTFFNPVRVPVSASWRRFLVMLVLGIGCGFALSLFSIFLLGEHPDLTFQAGTVGIIIAVGNGEARKLLRQMKEKYKQVGPNTTVAIFSWKRFWRSSFIAFLLTFLGTFLIYFDLTVYDLSVYDPTFHRWTILYSINFIYFVVTLIALLYGAGAGIIVGIIYGAGHVILDAVARLSEQHYLRISIVFGILANLIPLLAALFIVFSS